MPPVDLKAEKRPATAEHLRQKVLRHLAIAAARDAADLGC
jgi:hypothetical protein